MSDNLNNLFDDLKNLYLEKVPKLEKEYKFSITHTQPLSGEEITKKPLVLVLGPYSTGKTTFINQLLGQSYPGANVGPEPTTECFVAIMGGEEELIVQGPTAIATPNAPFLGLSKYGTGFLSHFTVAKTKNPILENMILVDTPGILSGQKQRQERDYDFYGVTKWFISQADLILFLFDSEKLDFSDEVNELLSALNGKDSKTRMVLNKTDKLSSFELFHVYGGLLWSLRKVITTPEVPKIHIVSFQENLNVHSENQKLLEEDHKRLLADFTNLPWITSQRKVNSLFKRIQDLIIHIEILSYLRKKTPTFFGVKAKQRKLLEGLSNIFDTIAENEQLPRGDFPRTKTFKMALKKESFKSFNKKKPTDLELLRNIYEQKLPKLLNCYPEVHGSVFTTQLFENPFTGKKSLKKILDEKDWKISTADEEKYCRIFNTIQKDGFVSSVAAKRFFVKTQLPQEELGQIWDLVDTKKEGKLTKREFSIGLHLLKIRMEHGPIPSSLPSVLLQENSLETEK